MSYQIGIVPSYWFRNIVDIDECDQGQHDCDTNANCINKPGTYDCDCKIGFTGNGTHCLGKLCPEQCHLFCQKQILLNPAAHIHYAFLLRFSYTSIL